MTVCRHECMNGEVLVMQKVRKLYSVYTVSTEMLVAPTYHLKEGCLQHASEVYNETLGNILEAEVCDQD